MTDHIGGMSAHGVRMREERQFVSETADTISVLAAHGSIVSFRRSGEGLVVRAMHADVIGEVGFGFWDRMMARSWLSSGCEAMVPGLLRNSRKSVELVLRAMVECGFELPDTVADTMRLPGLDFERYRLVIRERGS